jgi:hypothetical protein
MRKLLCVVKIMSSKLYICGRRSSYHEALKVYACLKRREMSNDDQQNVAPNHSRAVLGQETSSTT